MWFTLLFALFLNLGNHSLAQEATDSSSIPTSLPSASLTTPTPSSDSLFQKYHADYQYQIKVYQDTYKTYTEKKQINLKYGTVTTQKDIFDATKEVLVARDNLFRAYIQALRVYLEKYKSENIQDIEKSQIELQAWESWLNEQNLIIESINNNDDLHNFIDEFIPNLNLIQKSIYHSLIKNDINHKKYILNQLLKIQEELKNSPDMPAEGLQWFNPIAVKIDLVNQAFASANDSASRTQRGDTFDNFYPEAKNTLNKVDGYLLDISKTLKSIIIKFQNPNG